jgi:hypothetical protein
MCANEDRFVALVPDAALFAERLQGSREIRCQRKHAFLPTFPAQQDLGRTRETQVDRVHSDRFRDTRPRSCEEEQERVVTIPSRRVPVGYIQQRLHICRGEVPRSAQDRALARDVQDALRDPQCAGVAGRHKPHEQPEGVAIRGDGQRTRVALVDQAATKEGFQQGRQPRSRLHRTPPLRPKARRAACPRSSGVPVT